MGRVEKLEKAAREKGYLEQDESVNEVAVARIGYPVDMEAKEAFGYATKRPRFALLATDRRLHAVKLGQVGFGSVKDRVFDAPLDEAQVERSVGEIKLGRRGKEAEWIFKTPPVGSGAKSFVAYVDSRG